MFPLVRVCVVFFFLFCFFHSVKPCFSLTKTLQLQLLWIILVASCAALIIQSLAARLGVVTGWYFMFVNLLHPSILPCEHC